MQPSPTSGRRQSVLTVVFLLASTSQQAHGQGVRQQRHAGNPTNDKHAPHRQHDKTKKANDNDEEISLDRLEQFIDLASGYLVRVSHTTPEEDVAENAGKFTYMAHLDEPLRHDFVQAPQSSYNLLRHNGAIYALGQAYQRRQRQLGKDDDATNDATLLELREAMQRSIAYMVHQSIGPVPDMTKQADQSADYDDHVVASYPHHLPNLLASWETKWIAPRTPVPCAKLGGTGLALLALASTHALVDPWQATNLDTLRQLAAFLEYMQNPDDGSFTSRYKPTEGGKDDSWHSLYYPGEACMGLTHLAALVEDDAAHQRRWWRVSVNALLYLEQLRRDQPLSAIQPDHWALLATAALWPHLTASEDDEESRERIYQHGIMVVRHMLEETGGTQHMQARRGCLTVDGATCPTATRLEGLIAALSFVRDTERVHLPQFEIEKKEPEDEVLLKDAMWHAIRLGINFLLHSQETSEENEMQGAIPQSYPNDDDEEQQRQVRVDYVQHALSAVIAYEQHVLPPAAEPVASRRSSWLSGRRRMLATGSSHSTIFSNGAVVFVASGSLFLVAIVASSFWGVRNKRRKKKTRVQ